MLMKYIGSLYLFISKVSSRIGVSLKGRQGIQLSLIPSPFLPLPSPFIPSPFSIPFCSYSLIPPFQFNPLSHPNCLLLFPSPSPLSLLQVPSPSPFPLPFSLYSLLPSFSSPALFLLLSIFFSIYFACSHLISSHSLLSLH